MNDIRKPNRTGSVAGDIRWAKLAEATAESSREIERAVAEAVRRDRQRRREDGGEHSADQSGEHPFRCVDSFEVAPLLNESGVRVRVLVVERLRETRDALSSADLVRRFGLTRREAEVALALADRQSSAEIAATLGITVNTARRHSERVLEKLDIRSRRDIDNVLGRREHRMTRVAARSVASPPHNVADTLVQ
jgi:DNA-binding CsgD family transcriptional regulator